MIERQTTFSELPVFSELQLLDGVKSKIVNHEIPFEEEKHRVVTNISAIEVLYPFILQKEGLIRGNLEASSGLMSDPKPTIIGLYLHDIDALLSAVANGSTGVAIKQVFPTYQNPEKRAPFEYATDGIEFAGKTSKDNLYELMTKATSRYKKVYLENKRKGTKDRPLLPGFKVDAEREIEVVSDSETNNIERRLIEAWAREFGKPEPLTWEFMEKTIIHREVSIILNLVGLQFKGRLDSIVRLDDSDKLVVSQITDFKTGTAKPRTDLEKEISFLQIQMMRLMSEWFTAHYFAKRKSLSTEKAVFMFDGNPGNKASIRRLNQFAYRRFDQKTGEMTVEIASLDEDSRALTEKWLNWYEVKVHEYKKEVENLKRNKTQYDLRNIEIVR